MRLRLIISYDGTPFSGWQSQPSGNAVQDILEKAFWGIMGERVVVHGAGRTDAGVHAMGQCAHVDVPEGKMSLGDWRRALNAHLPREIRVLKAYRADANFHARWSAKAKIYRYRIWNGEVMSPLDCNRIWHVPGPLDFELLCSSVALFEGKHNFAAFSANRGKKYIARQGSSERVLQRVQVTRYTRRDIRLTFVGEGFLYKMVRMLTGAAVRVAQGKENLEWIFKALAFLGETKKNQFVAPAHGLYLVRVCYGTVNKI